MSDYGLVVIEPNPGADVAPTTLQEVSDRLGAREAARAAESACNLLYDIQNDVGRLMLSRGPSMKPDQEPR